MAPTIPDLRFFKIATQKPGKYSLFQSSLPPFPVVSNLGSERWSQGNSHGCKLREVSSLPGIGCSHLITQEAATKGRRQEKGQASHPLPRHVCPHWKPWSHTWGRTSQDSLWTWLTVQGQLLRPQMPNAAQLNSQLIINSDAPFVADLLPVFIWEMRSSGWVDGSVLSEDWVVFSKHTVPLSTDILEEMPNPIMNNVLAS